MSISDHYTTLEIEFDASDEEIKRAFRRLAKKFHPDKNPGREKAAEREFKLIMSAYEVLSKPESRNIYDRMLQTSRANKQDKREENLRKRAKKDIAYLCKLILFELLNKNTQQALEIYEKLTSERTQFALDPYMDDEDIRDCEFLLAEAYHQRSNLSEAARLYEKVLERENKRAYFYNFAQEIRLMLRDVYLQRIASAGRSEEILVNVEKILAMGLPRRDMAWVCKKAAEAYYQVNDIGSAIEALRCAFQINPKLKGAKRISRRLGIIVS